MKNWLLLLVLCLLAGCNLGLEADRATYDAIAPEYVAYVDSDATLTPEQKERRHETVRSWEAKLKKGDDGVATEDAHLTSCGQGPGPCGCDPVIPPCSMPCSGCCPNGCQPQPPVPGRGR